MILYDSVVISQVSDKFQFEKYKKSSSKEIHCSETLNYFNLFTLKKINIDRIHCSVNKCFILWVTSFIAKHYHQHKTVMKVWQTS